MPVDIHSKESRDLLDIIDKLRSQGLGGYVDLPQIIVCGNQSSGKSSVLEAISGLAFPSKDALCTRFATELILRRDDEARIDVSIIPHANRSDAEKAALAAFTAELTADHDIGAVIEDAKVAMGLDDTTGKRFSDDVLRIQLSGPEQQLLTLVDLPGLFEAGNSQQSTDEAPIVKKLVLDYMKNNRSIILATVTAATEFTTQSVTRYSRSVDARGLRTMGLITKPDKLDAGSESESSYVQLAANRDVVLKLGWHVLKNRDYKQKHFTSAERDASEAAFFEKPERKAWAAVDPACLGVQSLRARLSDVLHQQIVQQLPSMLKELETKLGVCNAELDKLGMSRQTVHEQRQFLTRISSKFSALMQAAVDGNYADVGFFGTATAFKYQPRCPEPEEPEEPELEESELEDSEPEDLEPEDLESVEVEKDEKEKNHRLRAVVQNRLTAFNKELALSGHTRRIIDGGGGGSKIAGKKKKAGTRREDYIDTVKAIIAQTRGRELPGLFNPLVVGDLFREQSKKWKPITDKSVSGVVMASTAAIRAALETCALPDTADMIFTAMITPALDKLKAAMDVRLAGLYVAQTDSHPITYNHYLTENVQKARKARTMKKLEPLFEEVGLFKSHAFESVKSYINKALDAVQEPDMEKVAASDAIDYMEAYYKVALKRFSDDVCILVVEQCLMSRLPGLFTPETVCGLTDDDVARLAGESGASVAERKRLVAKGELFRKGIQDLGRFL